MNCYFCYINPVCVTLENTKLNTKDKYYFFELLREGKVKPETANLCSITQFFFLSGFDSEKSSFHTIPDNLVVSTCRSFLYFTSRVLEYITNKS